METDAWGIVVGEEIVSFEGILEFEDNFKVPKIGIDPLPDSKQYLESLERKLNKIRRDSNILAQLSEKKEECLKDLLNDEKSDWKKEGDIDFDAPVSNGESAVQELYRHIKPEQPLSVGEIVSIVQYDQLEEKYKTIQEESDSTDSK